MFQMFFKKLIKKYKKYVNMLVSMWKSGCRQIRQWLILWTTIPSQTPSILLCADSLMKNGGVEKRLKQYATIWHKRGYKVFFGARVGNGPIHVYFTSFRLYNMYLLRWIRRIYGVSRVEFNVGGKSIPFLDLSALNQNHIPTGIILHASAPTWSFDYLQGVSYVICSHAAHGKRVPCLAKFPVLPNAIPVKETCWRFCRQKEALLISRLAEDKRPSIEAFIELCFAWNISFRIAGDFTDRQEAKLKKEIQHRFRLKENVFLGRIDTTTFLENHWGQFLFVGGLGQVILEAGQLNYPCLVASLLGAQQSFWVTRANVRQLIEYNCSPHYEEESILLKQNQNLTACLSDIRVGKTDLFEVGDIINKCCNLETCLTKYENITQGERSNI